jgi:integrase
VDVNLERGELFTRWDDNKGARDEVIPIHPVVADHLRPLWPGNAPLVFPWTNDPRTLWVEFARIQEVAGIHLICRDNHDHTRYCHVYGFHDFRRAFATANAPRMKAEVLQRLMRHKSYQTTQKSYINPTSQMQDAVLDMPVPDAIRRRYRGQVDPGEDGEKK